ncbi:twin-arginine translocase TatA/TatE family subunit [Candidatus Woesearchaeota archaeon]|nr:twin-arginine translocase TatA/TatE family subunit [Candidatus Woesearchaeota archaeon]
MGLIGGLELPELIVILFIILLFVGADKLPELAQALGKSVNEFKKAMKTEEEKPKKKKKSSEELAG